MKTLEEIKNLPANVKIAGGRKITPAQVTEMVKKIRNSGKYYTVDEVRAMFVPKVNGQPVISRFRTKKILDKKCNGVTLARFYDGKRFWYGKPITK